MYFFKKYFSTETDLNGTVIIIIEHIRRVGTESVWSAGPRLLTTVGSGEGLTGLCLLLDGV